jgi:hypothetical protein
MLRIANFIRKYWVLFAVVGLYFLLAGLNLMPYGLNIFKKKQLLIDDTPVVVKEIRELGELITSEFYGEVYADLNEVYDDLITNKKDSILLNPTIFYQYYSGLEDYMENSSDQRAKELEYKAELERYEGLLKSYLTKQEEFKQNEKLINEEIAEKNNKKEKRKLENRLEDLRTQLKNDKKDLEDTQQKLKSIEKDYRETRLKFWETRKRRNLVYIARGWVKAGVNLKNITEDDIILDEDDSASIQILIDDPVILDADINPWFIPEKKIKGFEVFIAKTGSILSEKNFTDEEVTELKKKCKEKLKQDAIEKGLLTNAETSTIQTLENFFHLVGFKKVDVLFKSRTIVIEK